MKTETKFFICRHCGNLVQLVRDAGVPVVCCGDDMTEIKANTVDASYEKHIPAVKVEGEDITVTVGSMPHPMTAEHHIEWVYLETDKGGQLKRFKVNEDPVLRFKISSDDSLIAAYAYCNLHGLWKAEIK